MNENFLMPAVASSEGSGVRGGESHHGVPGMAPNPCFTDMMTLRAMVLPLAAEFCLAVAVVESEHRVGEVQPRDLERHVGAKLVSRRGIEPRMWKTLVVPARHRHMLRLAATFGVSVGALHLLGCATSVASGLTATLFEICPEA